MSVSLSVNGYKPADEKWAKMKEIWDTCKSLGFQPPKEVCTFFDGEPPGDKPGMECSLGDSISDWCSEYESGYEIDVSKIPVDIRVIRAYLS